MPECQKLIYSSVMTERPREIGNFKRVGHFGAKFKVKGLHFAPLFMDR